MKKLCTCVGPIILSALSLFTSFAVLHPLAIYLGPEFNLLASRGIGKVAFISMVIFQILLFLSVQPKIFLQKFLDRTVFFFIKERWLWIFSYFFISFFSLHWLILLLFYKLGYVTPITDWGTINFAVIYKTLFGLFVVFMLAWTEELIFRGTIYPYFAQFYKIVPSLLVTSLIFMIVHNLANPLALITYDWKLGLGLFLLGVLLNQIFVITKKFYAGMGIHAGLVFVKIVLRRARFLTFTDLRQSHIVHVLFIFTILFLFARYKKEFWKDTNL
jgi:membrane protease YdiL (CAAX protease family)